MCVCVVCMCCCYCFLEQTLYSHLLQPTQLFKWGPGSLGKAAHPAVTSSLFGYLVFTGEANPQLSLSRLEVIVEFQVP